MRCVSSLCAKEEESRRNQDSLGFDLSSLHATWRTAKSGHTLKSQSRFSLYTKYTRGTVPEMLNSNEMIWVSSRDKVQCCFLPFVPCDFHCSPVGWKVERA